MGWDALLSGCIASEKLPLQLWTQQLRCPVPPSVIVTLNSATGDGKQDPENAIFKIYPDGTAEVISMSEDHSKN